MIVTKEMAQRYLIKRGCYLITTAPNGDYMMTATSVHWKEGMEVFESAEECHAAIDKLRQQRMDSGHCPRCKYEYAGETEKDISYLTLVTDKKQTKIYQCKECQSLWVKGDREKLAFGYDKAMLDYLLEWSTRDLRPSTEMTSVLREIGDVSADKSFKFFPAHVRCKDGTERNAALIKLVSGPPPPSWFTEKTDWLYFDQVTGIQPSPLAYPFGIAKYIVQKLSVGRSEMLYVRDIDTKEIFSFEIHAGIFMPKELQGRNFEMVHDIRKLKIAPPYFLPADRGGPDDWTMTQTKPVMIWGDL